ncbi:class I SAM-dependent methyltransferase [Paenibacillus pinihumi]|uniref:class I SAM-dependent methyltransferase n=1 Tax=Paenibacillus pinihumi TaxID=669462 RepID=UPI000405E120|nr:methyltransferase domain-containing protein [Paenibacillus pinihumi]
MKEYEQTGVAMTCRSFEEYERMFSLSAADCFKGPVLDIAAGASSFTAESRQRGMDAVATDPRYAMEPEDIAAEAAKEIEVSTSKLASLKDQFDWSYYGSIDRHRLGRLKSMNIFYADYVSSRTNVYLPGSLPDLPFADDQFTMVLCSHFLFLYGDQKGVEFHMLALKEMLRVTRRGGSIRIYPLLNLRYEPYPQLEELLEAVRQFGGEPKTCPSSLSFIPDSTSYLKIIKN